MKLLAFSQFVFSHTLLRASLLSLILGVGSREQFSTKRIWIFEHGE